MWVEDGPDRTRRLLRSAAAVLVLAAVTAVAWELWMVVGQGPEDYPVWRVAGLVLTLAAAVVAASWLGWVFPTIVSVPVALAAAAFVDWGAEDETGLFIVGVLLILFGAVTSVTCVALTVAAVAGRLGAHADATNPVA